MYAIWNWFISFICKALAHAHFCQSFYVHFTQNSVFFCSFSDEFWSKLIIRTKQKKHVLIHRCPYLLFWLLSLMMILMKFRMNRLNLNSQTLKTRECNQHFFQANKYEFLKIKFNYNLLRSRCFSRNFDESEKKALWNSFSLHINTVIGTSEMS